MAWCEQRQAGGRVLGGPTRHARPTAQERKSRPGLERTIPITLPGSIHTSRKREPVHQVAACRRCGQERAGWTTFESMASGNKPVGHPVHFCDQCAAGIVERPLDEVLLEILAR